MTSARPDRREFLAGFGAAVVALVPVRTGWPPRTLRPIDMSRFIGPPYGLTFEKLAWAIQYISTQVMGLGQLTPAEAMAVTDMVDDAIMQIRPAGIKVVVSASWDRIMARQFALIEDPVQRPGTVSIVDVSTLPPHSC